MGARYDGTHFLVQYLFVRNIKSTYQVDMPGTKNLDVGANAMPWGVIYTAQIYI